MLQKTKLELKLSALKKFKIMNVDTRVTIYALETVRKLIEMQCKKQRVPPCSEEQELQICRHGRVELSMHFLPIKWHKAKTNIEKMRKFRQGKIMNMLQNKKLRFQKSNLFYYFRGGWIINRLWAQPSRREGIRMYIYI